MEGRFRLRSCIALTLCTATLFLVSCANGDPEPPGSETLPLGSAEHLFVMYSSNTPRALFDSFFTEGDYVRTDTPAAADVTRRYRYALVTTLRRRWNGHPGVRAWTERGCGPASPGLIVYDPEFRLEWTPPSEPKNLIASVRAAARMVRATGCHRFGIAPGALPFFGLDPIDCDVDLAAGVHNRLPWRSIDLVDIQAQRLLGEHCLPRGGMDLYERTVSELAASFKRANPEIEVLGQVSFRDSEASTMRSAISRIADEVDGIYFSYPTNNPDFACNYCEPRELKTLLRYLNQPRR